MQEDYRQIIEMEECKITKEQEVEYTIKRTISADFEYNILKTPRKLPSWVSIAGLIVSIVGVILALLRLF